MTTLIIGFLLGLFIGWPIFVLGLYSLFFAKGDSSGDAALGIFAIAIPPHYGIFLLFYTLYRVIKRPFTKEH